MRNVERRPIQPGVDDAGINFLLTEARKDERRNRAEVMAARLERIAIHVVRSQMNATAAAELLCAEAEKIRNEAREIC